MIWQCEIKKSREKELCKKISDFLSLIGNMSPYPYFEGSLMYKKLIDDFAKFPEDYSEQLVAAFSKQDVDEDDILKLAYVWPIRASVIYTRIWCKYSGHSFFRWSKLIIDIIVPSSLKCCRHESYKAWCSGRPLAELMCWRKLMDIVFDLIRNA